MPGVKGDDYDVVIVGAGVGGAAFALALAHEFPLRVLLLERHTGPGKINRGDSLLPAITAHLERWQALDRCRAAGARELPRMQVFHHRAGLLMETRLDSLGLRHPYLVLPHPEIERALTEAAVATGRVAVRYRCRVARLLEEGASVCGVVLHGDDDAEETIRARLVVGADGANSTVRAALGIPLPRRPYDHSYFGVEVERPVNYEDAMRVELHPAGGILVVPHPSGLRVGLGVLVRPREEELFRSGSLEQKMDAIRRRSLLFADCRPFPQGSHLYKLARAHAPRYHSRRAALLGDAVHITNPTAGQGMTMAVEDAVALARHVGPALTAGAALERPLRAYEHERRPLNVALIRWSHVMACFYAMDGGIGDWLRRRLFGLGGTSFGQRVQREIWSRVASRDAGPRTSELAAAVTSGE
jgi:2-polyprenyl-6-methoxyphenol hydroxylase-like FAD-dependent oxidoreductase